MRKEFIETLEKIAARDKRVIVIVGDLGYTVMERFRDRFPDRFINAGVAEGNMVGIAAGLALSGFTPLCYSIGTFMSLRPFEQIRDDVCVNNLNVKLVGVGAGLGYSIYGPTHHSMEDIGILRTLPNMTIFSPADPVEMKLVLQATFRHKGPVYLRIPRRQVKRLHENKPKFIIGKAILVRPGNRAAIFATGTMVERAVAVAGALAASGKKVAVYSFPTIKPLDDELVRRVARSIRFIVTLEPHGVIGGLGSAIAEVLAQMPQRATLNRFGIPNEFIHEAGSEDYFDKKFGLDTGSLARSISKLL